MTDDLGGLSLAALDLQIDQQQGTLGENGLNHGANINDRPPFSRGQSEATLVDLGDKEDQMTVTEDWYSARLSSSDETMISAGESYRLQQLEEEQERLNNSLFSLSTHFAQVQFRLKQIGDASGEDKEKLLKDLQEFAFKECTDMNELQRLRSESDSDAEVLNKQNARQNELIRRLKEQLEELERYAYESGEGDVPTTVVIQRQKAVLDKLHEKMQLNLQLDCMSQAEIQKHIDDALKQLVNPFREKEQLVEQLQTQIVDLERFVQHLQIENEQMAEGSGRGSVSPVSMSTPVRALSSTPMTSSKAKPSGLLGGLVGCGSTRFQKNQLKNTLKANHYGDERAHLQLAVDAVEQVLGKYTLLHIEKEEDTTSTVECDDVFDDEVFGRSNEEVVTVIRKQLCPSLRALLEHGMLSQVARPSASIPIPGFGCFSARNTTAAPRPAKPRPLTHIWDVIVFFYELKQGRDMTDAPVRKLSQSFRLDSVAGRSVTSKDVLLTTIENIVNSHARLKRSNDSMWKAFVSAALNEKKLPAWIRIIFRTRQIVEMCYNSWSYVARTGCEELYTLLEDLHKYNLDLPVDLALRPFQQMKDAF